MSSYTHPSAWQWYATADELINIRHFYSINGVPVPVRSADGKQQGYYPTIDDKQNDRNYQMFYNQKYGRTNKFGVKEYWVLKEKYIDLQQQISDKYDVITYKPNDRIAQVKTKGENTKVSTRPPRRTPIQEPTPVVIDTAQHEFEEQLRLEAGGKIQEVIPEVTTQPQSFSFIPEAAAEPEPEPEISVIPEVTTQPQSFSFIPEAAAEPTTNETITNNMITQRIDHFTIEDGRAKGQITFTLNDNFNPFYYGKNITNIITFKTKAGVNILPFIKQNTLRFTATERDETIQYNEDMKGNTIADLESFVWSSPTNPTAFSPVLRSEIREGKEAVTTKDGFMAMGLTGAIALLIGIGLILPDKMRRKK
jgi:hypothetical protein